MCFGNDIRTTLVASPHVATLKTILILYTYIYIYTLIEYIEYIYTEEKNKSARYLTDRRWRRFRTRDVFDVTRSWTIWEGSCVDIHRGETFAKLGEGRLTEKVEKASTDRDAAETSPRPRRHFRGACQPLVVVQPNRL